MKSMTIHQIDEALALSIKQHAETAGISVNKAVKRILEDALVAKKKASDRNRKSFEPFCGVWSDAELAEFEQVTGELDHVDRADWL
jgi:hypothetical protein